jgi:hypothetical protein
MIRASLLVTFGLGFATMPDPAWLVAMALATLLGPRWWGRKPSAKIVRLATTRGQHYHYCTGCDRQWPHEGDGTRCTRHWACQCPDCPAGSDPASRIA